MDHPVHRKEAVTAAVSSYIENETRIHVGPGQSLSSLRLDNPDSPLDIEDIQ